MHPFVFLNFLVTNIIYGGLIRGYHVSLTFFPLLILCLVLLQVPKCLCRSKFFEPVPKIDCISCLFKTFCAGTKTNFTECTYLFVWRKMFVTATICKYIFGLAQKIWTSTKHFGNCKRTRH